jgi:hypothetical protein
MRTRHIILLALAVGLGGCETPMIWDKAGATQENYNVDSYQCEKDARQAGYYGTGLAGAQAMRGFFQRCMVSKGYTLRQTK